MPQKPAPKDARKRTKKSGKIADLPAKSVKAKDAAKVKGGIVPATELVGNKANSLAAKIGATALKISNRF